MDPSQLLGFGGGGGGETSAIGPMDLLIASIGLANNLVLVTSNTREFE